MGIEPVKMSTGKKIAIAAGAAAAVGLGALAYSKGKGSDAFVKALENVKNNVEGAKKLNFFQTMGEGFKAIGNQIGTKVTEVCQAVPLAISTIKTVNGIPGALSAKDIKNINEVHARTAFSSEGANKIAYGISKFVLNAEAGVLNLVDKIASKFHK